MAGEPVEIVYRDEQILVCVKPAGILSTDEPGGLPELLRQELGAGYADLRTVHRLDRVVSGLMVLARGASAASALSRQIREGSFGKVYLAVVHGTLPETGSLRDLLRRDKARKMTFVADAPGKDVQEALLDYRSLGRAEGLSLVKIRLRTGRTHQIRCQFAAHGWPLAGERKYDTREDPWPLALWSAALGFRHPATGEELRFALLPQEAPPWDFFTDLKIQALYPCKDRETGVY
ncbi:MAG: RluA family pseudouridine synthase [Oscillospiraceae bacterium]|nr:RluA family pseudouridine synthase [Oscillospiraceae bacterium]